MDMADEESSPETTKTEITLTSSVCVPVSHSDGIKPFSMGILEMPGHRTAVQIKWAEASYICLNLCLSNFVSLL